MMESGGSRIEKNADIAVTSRMSRRDLNMVITDHSTDAPLIGWTDLEGAFTMASTYIELTSNEQFMCRNSVKWFSGGAEDCRCAQHAWVHFEFGTYEYCNLDTQCAPKNDYIVLCGANHALFHAKIIPSR